MKTEVNGETVVVKFWHNQDEKVLTVEDEQRNVIQTPVKAETNCLIETPFGNYLGTAYCSVLDQFNKAKGRKLAFTRALRVAPFDKVERAILWNDYFTRMNG